MRSTISALLIVQVKLLLISGWPRLTTSYSGAGSGVAGGVAGGDVVRVGAVVDAGELEATVAVASPPSPLPRDHARAVTPIAAAMPAPITEGRIHRRLARVLETIEASAPPCGLGWGGASSVHALPFHHRRPPELPSAGYQPGVLFPSMGAPFRFLRPLSNQGHHIKRRSFAVRGAPCACLPQYPRIDPRMTDTTLEESPLLLTVDQAAARLRVHATSLRKLTADGELACVRIGRKVMVTPDQITEFIEDNRKAAVRPPPMSPEEEAAAAAAQEADRQAARTVAIAAMTARVKERAENPWGRSMRGERRVAAA